MHTLWWTHLGLIAIKMHICVSSQQKNLVYALWQKVPKLVYTFWTCKPVNKKFSRFLQFECRKDLSYSTCLGWSYRFFTLVFMFMFFKATETNLFQNWHGPCVMSCLGIQQQLCIKGSPPKNPKTSP